MYVPSEYFRLSCIVCICPKHGSYLLRVVIPSQPVPHEHYLSRSSSQTHNHKSAQTAVTFMNPCLPMQTPGFCTPYVSVSGLLFFFLFIPPFEDCSSALCAILFLLMWIRAGMIERQRALKNDHLSNKYPAAFL